MNDQHLIRFLDGVRATSGLVAYANLAAFKWRNSLLGFDAGDREIADLDERLRSMVAPIAGHSHRVAGDAWLVFVPTGCDAPFADVIAAFAAPVVNKRAGWKGSATLPSGKNATRESAVAVSVRRGVRLVHAAFESPAQLRERIVELESSAHLAEVNVPIALQSVQGRAPLPRWRCFDGELPPLFCPHCAATDFSWTGGADDCAEGTCKRCGAEVDFRYF